MRNIPWFTDLKLPSLEKGPHSSPHTGVCAMELVAFIERLPHSDSPPCTCPVIAAFVRGFNDLMTDQERQTLLPYLPQLVGTVSVEHQQMRAEIAAWQAIKVFAPLALTAAGLHAHAAILRDFDKKQGLTAAADAAAAAADAAAARYAAAAAARYAAAAAAADAAARYAAAAAAAAAADAAARYAAAAADAAAADAARYAAAAADAAADAARYAAAAAADAADAAADAARYAAADADAAAAAAADAAARYAAAAADAARYAAAADADADARKEIIKAGFDLLEQMLAVGPKGRFSQDIPVKALEQLI